MIRAALFLLSVTLLAACSPKSESNFDFQLPFETSEGSRTATYDETLEFCKAIDHASSRVHYTTYGESSQGYKLPLLIVDKDGLNRVETIRATGRTILLVESNIHPGEPDGNDAMMLLLRDIITGKSQELLDSVTILFAPVVNADGLNRFGAYNRINQNGPEKMGWRTNAQNLNLNRDFVKADAPGMQAWIQMFDKWQPDFFIDCHTTDGADYQYVITYMLEIYGNMDPGLTAWQAEDYLPYVRDGMFEAGYPIFPYVSFRSWHDPRSGLITRPGRPMLSQGYTALKNRPGLLIETHMLKPYKERVLATREMIELTLEKLNHKGSQLQQLIADADQVVQQPGFREKTFAVAYRNTEQHDTVDFLGVEYDVVKSDLTGGNWFQYHKGENKTFRLPWYRYPEASEEVMLPEAYVIPVQWNKVINRLQMHGIQMDTLPEETTLPTETYYFTDVKWRNSPYEGRMTIDDFTLHSRKDSTTFPKGSVIIPMNQSNARLIAWMLEPESADSFLQWGFFNAVFEQKEYAETYVMEVKARRMLENDPELREAFDAFLSDNPGVKNSSWAQLNWFYKRTKWWDEKKNVYPVKRIMSDDI